MQRRKNPPLRTGTLTLLITVVVLCLAVLAMLVYSTARADRLLAEKSMNRFGVDIECENAAQQWLADVDAALAAGTALPDGLTPDADGIVATNIEGEDGRRVTVELRVLPKGSTPRYEILRWELGQTWYANDELNLWDGQ